MEFLSDTNELAAADVLVFVREAIQRFEQLKPLIVTKLLEVFASIRTVRWAKGIVSMSWVTLKFISASRPVITWRALRPWPFMALIFVAIVLVIGVP